MSRLRFCLFWVGVAVVALGWVWARVIRPPACEQVVHRGVLDLGQEVADPAGPWVARLRREACGDGWFITVVSTVVEVASQPGASWAEVARLSRTHLDDVAADWLQPAVLEVQVQVLRQRHVELKPYGAPGLTIRVTTAP